MPKRILLADDSITIQKVVELTFSDGDYEVTAVNNGARAIAKLGEMRPDIILSDIIMPEKNGYEVCEYVKSHPEYRNIPVVLLTGTFEPFDPDRAEKAGCDAVVTKPFESQSLIHKVEELISQAATAAAAAPPPAPPAPEPMVSAPAEEAPSPWMDDAVVEAEARPSPFTTSGGSYPAPPEAYAHDNDIFGAAPPPAPPAPMQFAAPEFEPAVAPNADPPFGTTPPVDAFSGETRAFQRMAFDDAPEAEAPAPPAEPSPWDEPDFGGETRAFGKMTFEDLQAMAPQGTAMTEEVPLPVAAPQSFSAPEPASAAEPPASPEPFASPSSTNAFDPPVYPPSFDAPAFETPSFNTPAFDAPAFDAPAFTPPTYDTPAFDAPAFDTPFDAPPQTDAFSGETPAFAGMSFEEGQQPADLQPPPPAPESEAAPAGEEQAAAPSPWDEPAASPFGAPADDAPLPGPGATQAFPRVSFDALDQSMPSAPHFPQQDSPVKTPAFSASESASEQSSPWDEQPTPSSTSDGFQAGNYEELATPPAAEPAWEESAPAAADDAFVDAPTEPAAAQPFASTEPATGDASFEPPAQEPAWDAIATADAAAGNDDPAVPPTSLAPAAAAPAAAVLSSGDAGHSSDLSEEQIDRIARRVVEMLSDHVIRNIAWEVIPDLAEMVVKERIRQLESEA